MKDYLNDVYYDEFIQKIFHLFSITRDVDTSVSILLLCQILESLSSRELKDDSVLKVIDSSDIIFEFKFNQDKKVLSALIVKGIDQNKVDYTHIIMPMN